MNEIQQIADRRLQEINYAETRIKAKIACNHSRSADLERRLEEYSYSKKALEIELETGEPMKVNGVVKGITIKPTAAFLALGRKK